MGKTSTREQLLTACAQDLHAGEQLLVERLPGIVRHVSDPALRGLLEGQIGQSASQAERLRQTGEDVDGPPNLWMAGIMDDAERDTRSIEAGPLLDVALIGAVRKAKASEIVSYETAVATAEALGSKSARIFDGILQEERMADAALRARLHDLSIGGSERTGTN